MVTDVVLQTLEGDLAEVRMSDEVLDATLAEAVLFDAVYKQYRHRGVQQGEGHPGRPLEKVRERPEEFLDLRTVAGEGLNAAARGPSPA